ncbi:hypothetical protein Dfri01_68850 [Dyadobacter frigoris]|uniref:hypothetical protein n=1 Tax=Dyadobacter frigoris TaxID=2576211 RepID=UPI00249FF7C5|nr:hypothetical protein [Dyadobacter frigoris]GLU57424.1 hypothetical protein Dfri01_68850 [Dyadobacter frigoris]
MLFQADDFQVEFENITVSVKVMEMASRTVFQLNFPDGRKPLIISRAKAFDGHKVWMSIPEGRQAEAIPIGAKIVEHFLNLKND